MYAVLTFELQKQKFVNDISLRNSLFRELLFILP